MKNLIIYAASAMFALTACNALDIIPSDSYSDPVVWQDQNLIKMYVNDQYNSKRELSPDSSWLLPRLWQ